MIVGIDNISPGTSTTSRGLGGMRHFLQSLVTRLPAALPGTHVKLFTPDWCEPFQAPPSGKFELVNLAGVPTNPARRVLFEQGRLGAEIRQHGINLWLATCNTLPYRLHCVSVLFVQSLQYFTYPPAFRLYRRLYLRVVAPMSIRRANHVVVFSQASKLEIVRRFAVPPKKISVIYHALRFSRSELEDFDMRNEEVAVTRAVGTCDYILCVSAFYGFKNLPRLIQGFARLKPEFGHKLVLIGGDTEAVRQADLMSLARRLGVAEDVICLGVVPGQYLPMFYRHATLMAMPSLDETFGFPVLEAMACGCPVVTSNVSSMPEVAGGAAELVNPHRTESIEAGLRRVLTDSGLRHRMAEAGLAQARQFTYERFFSQLAAAINLAARQA